MQLQTYYSLAFWPQFKLCIPEADLPVTGWLNGVFLTFESAYLALNFLKKTVALIIIRGANTRHIYAPSMKYY